MKRFLVFPIVFGIIIACLLPLVVAESTIAERPLFGGLSFSIRFWRSIVDVPVSALSWAMIMGIVSGFMLALWDLARNRKNQGAANRLIPNLFWCGCYAFSFLAANCALAVSVLEFNKSGFIKGGAPFVYWVLSLFQLSVFALNSTAILWAAIRSIATDDVLSPRVLGRKLRQRARLQ